MCATVLPLHQPLGLLLKGKHGVLNVCNDVSECGAHEGKTGSDKSVQVLTWEELKKIVLHSYIARS